MPLINRLSSTVAALAIGLSVAASAQEQSTPSTPASDLNDGQRQLLRDEIRAYLLENPEVIFEAIEIYEQRRQQLAQQADKDLIAANRTAIFEDGHSFVGGNPEGDITLVEFSDYRCGYCRRAHPEIAKLLEQDDNIRLIVKEFPILGPESIAAGRIAIAALEIDPSLYGALNDKLMSFPQNLTEASAYRIAKSVGYDVEALKEVAASEETTAKLRENFDLARQLGLQGTPSFILGDEVIRGYLPLEEMQARVADARSAAKSAVK